MPDSINETEFPEIPSIRGTFAVVAVLCAIGFAINLFFTLQQNQILYQAEIDSLKQQVQRSFEQSRETLDRQFALFISHYIRMDEVMDAISRNDRQRLLALTKDDYDRLKVQEPYLYVMHFFDTQNVTILRMHKPHSYGDDLTVLRPIVAYVNRFNKRASGLEVGKNGITYRITIPVYNRQNDKIGVLEFGIKPEYFVEELRKRFGIKSQILVKTENLKKLIYQTDFPKIDRFSIVYKDDLFNQLALDPNKAYEILEQQDKKYLVISGIRLNSYSGEEVVRFQIVKDITAFSDKREYQMHMHIAMNVALFMLFLLILYFIFNRYNQHLTSAIYRLRVSERKQQVITTASQKDELTHAYNRRYFNKIMAELIANKNSATSLIFFDFDHFKMINDNYGHLIGDEVLKAMSAFVSAQFRADDLLFRWGGEEFCLVLINTELSVAVEKAEALRTRVAETLWPQGIKLTISLGVTNIRPEDDLNSLQSRLDDLLYKAKESGRNCCMAD